MENNQTANVSTQDIHALTPEKVKELQSDLIKMRDQLIEVLLKQGTPKYKVKDKAIYYIALMSSCKHNGGDLCDGFPLCIGLDCPHCKGLEDIGGIEKSIKHIIRYGW